MKRHKGFTLVEMLVALSVSALLIALTYGAVVAAQRSANAVRDAVAQSEVMRIGWQFIADSIGRAQAIPNPQDRDDVTGFLGTDTGLSFIADLPGYVSVGGLVRVTLSVDRDRDRQRLKLAHARFPPAAGDSQPTTTAEAILVDDLELIRIDYLGMGKDREAPTWRSEWQAEESLPSLVRIQIMPRGQATWPLLIARPLSGSTRIDVQDQESDTSDDAAARSDSTDPAPVQVEDDAT